jgi:predicted component of type VI protein secretion system
MRLVRMITALMLFTIIIAGCESQSKVTANRGSGLPAESSEMNVAHTPQTNTPFSYITNGVQY